MPEVPYAATHPLTGDGHYDPISIGDATTCPDRPWWWLVVAAAAGAGIGWQFSKAQRPQRRRIRR